MIAVLTNDAWTTATITLDDGGGAQVFTVSLTDARSVADEFVAWVNLTFTDTASWLWSRHSASGGALIAFLLPKGYIMTTNAAAQSILGAAAAGGPWITSTVWTSPAGSIVPPTPSVSAYVDNMLAADTARGTAAGSGVARVAVGGFAAYRPRVRWPAYAVDMERARAVQVDATSPRQAYIYGGAYGWFLASLGTVALSRSGLKLWRVTAEVMV